MFFYYTFLGLTSEIDVSTMFGIIYLSNQRKICSHSKSCKHSKSDFHVDFKISKSSCQFQDDNQSNGVSIEMYFIFRFTFNQMK